MVGCNKYPYKATKGGGGDNNKLLLLGCWIGPWNQRFIQLGGMFWQSVKKRGVRRQLIVAISLKEVCKDLINASNLLRADQPLIIPPHHPTNLCSCLRLISSPDSR